MNWSLKITLAILFIPYCSLDISKIMPLKETTDFSLSEKDWQNSMLQSPDNLVQDDDYSKLGLMSDVGISSDLKPSFAGLRNKYRMRRKRNGMRRRKFRENMENPYSRIDDDLHSIEDFKDPNFDEDYQEESYTDQDVPLRQRPLRRLKKIRDFREKIGKVDNALYEMRNQQSNKKETDSKLDNNAGKITDRPNEGYALIPEKDQIIILKNFTLTQATPERQIDHSKQPVQLLLPEQNDRKFVMTIQNVNPNIKYLSKDNSVKNNNEAKEEMHNNWKDNAEDLKSRIREEILKGDGTGLDKYLKMLEKDNEIAPAHNEKMIGISLNSPENTQANNIKSDLMKLNISINGLILNNDKPSQIRGKGTIKVHPRYTEERDKRGFNIPFFSKSKSKDEGPVERLKAEKNEADIKSMTSKTLKHKDDDIAGRPDISITPDRISHETVKMVCSMVRSNPEIKELWPSLKDNRPLCNGSEYSLRREAKRSSRRQIEEMLRKTMSTVNDMIEMEVQSRSCVPLTKELADFYEAILEMHAKQAKRREEHEEKLAKAENLDTDIKDELRSKSKSWSSESNSENSNDDDQDHDSDEDNAELDEGALFDMIHMRKLEFDREMSDARHRREAEKRNYRLMLDTQNSKYVRKLRQLYSPAFLKLNSIAENLQRAEEDATHQL